MVVFFTFCDTKDEIVQEFLPAYPNGYSIRDHVNANLGESLPFEHVCC